MKKKIVIILCALVSLSVTACGKTSSVKQESKFDNQINEFISELDSLDKKINAIDTTKENYEDELLGLLDETSDLFDQLMGFEEPEKYIYYDDLAKAAAYYMSEAVRYYHLTYDDEDYNPSFIDTAGEFYDEALQNVRYIGYMLEDYDVSDVIHEIDYTP